MSTRLPKCIESGPLCLATRVFVYGLAGALAVAVVGTAFPAPAQERARILWTNRGNDGFEQFQDPAAARAVVDDAIAAWEAVIQRFNYHGPYVNNHADREPERFYLELSLDDVNLPTTCNHQNAPSPPTGCTFITAIDPDGRPWRAETFFNEQTTYLTTPGASLHEFPKVVSPFGADKPGQVGQDLFTLAAHEIGHALGISGQSGLAIQQLLGPPDANGNRTLVTTWAQTVMNGSHLVELHDLMAAAAVVNSLGGAVPRRLVTDLDALILAGVYAYTVRLPSTLPNFLAVLDPMTGKLTVSADPLTPANRVEVSASGGSVVTDVNGIVSQTPAAATSQIWIQGTIEPDIIDVLSVPIGRSVVIKAGRGDDTAQVWSVPATARVDVVPDPRDGTDRVVVGDSTAGLDPIAGEVSVIGDRQSGQALHDRLEILDWVGAVARQYELGGTSLQRAGAGRITFTDLDGISIIAGAGPDQVTVTSLPSTRAFDFDLGAGLNEAHGPDAAETEWDVAVGRVTLDGVLSLTNVEHVVGGSGNERFVFANHAQLSTLDGGGGTDIVDYAAQTAPITVDLRTFSGIETVLGGAAEDTLRGPDTSNRWLVSDTDAGTLEGVATFAGVEFLTGGNGPDTFVFEFDGRLRGGVDGGLGRDSLDFSDWSDPVTVDLSVGSALPAAPSAEGIDEAVGGRAFDRLVGRDQDTVWRVEVPDSGTLLPDKVIIALPFAFVGFEQLQGGSARDRFVVANGASLLRGIDGGAGNDLLDLSALTIPVRVDLGTGSVTAAGRVAAVESFAGGQAADVLVGPNHDTSWQVDGRNQGTLSGGLRFASFESLAGGSGADRFMFTRDGVRLSGSLDGRAGRDAIEFPGYPRGVFADLSLRRATGIGGLVASIENVVGSPGPDHLTGDSSTNVIDGAGGSDTLRSHGGDDIVLGGDGDDDLAGGDGRDIVAGGFGADLVTGDGGDDIVLAGPLDLSEAALRAVAAEWSRTDRAYEQRIDALRQGGGLNGSVVLSAPSIVRNDSHIDRLTGGADLDWFWPNASGPLDLTTDFDLQKEKIG